ncbi:hypothetical protein M9H77_26978 [Catharanthus roseus]|uniref:Uncharacterized protein n=1 Tax=Catharanthus roseus TaxID=4058 RepID=A0ACC0ACS1_CATRO|nr:hypothetical protein M9H77_26978 [Catharanthus roseus]
MTINQCLVRRILIDTGSSLNVLFKETFKKTRISWDKAIPYAAPLVGFTDNNKVKHEALLAGLHMAISLKHTHLLARNDSQVVIGQVTGIFEAKEENMKQYLTRVQRLVSNFVCVNFEKKSEVSRVDPNRKLDPTWERPYRVMKDNGNESYKLRNFERKILAKTWNNLNLRKIFS